jgi:hypothetical protein
VASLKHFYPACGIYTTIIPARWLFPVYLTLDYLLHLSKRLLIGYWILATAWIFIWAFFYSWSKRQIPVISNIFDDHCNLL